jgi:uncharacterized protein YjbJ (UPF0337 family)
MDKDRITGMTKQAKGAVEEAVGNLLGDAKLVADGKRDKAAGKALNAIGSVKDSAKDALEIASKGADDIRIPPL